MADVTREEIRAVLEIMLAMSEAIRELGRVPSGVLYAQMMGALPGLSLQSYQSIVDRLVGAGLIKVVAHELIWIGPTPVEAPNG